MFSPQRCQADIKHLLQPEDFDRLNIIHVAGTKGKGSTSSFISSMLSQYVSPQDQVSKPPHKVGLYTSPHLRFVRERIQIDNQPITEAQFARYFFEIWDRLEETARKAGLPTDTTAKPVYFRYLTLMAFHTYLSEGVDAAVFECGVGGEYDSTNIIVNPIVTAITSLGIDHTAVLGDTIEQIAWHKAGIMKTGAKAFSVPQPDSAIQVLKERALEKKVDLQITSIVPEIADGTVPLGLDGEFQKINASAAVAVVGEFLSRMGHEPTTDQRLSPQIRKGIHGVRLGGRCETRREGNITWCIDGAHNLERLQLIGEWYLSKIQKQGKQPRIMIFNQAQRDAEALARRLHDTLASALQDEQPFDHVIFCTNTTFKQTGWSPDLVSIHSSTAPHDELKVQNALAAAWDKIAPGSRVHVFHTIEEAIDLVRNIARNDEQSAVTTLVTGSLHLVGGVLEVLESGNEAVD